MAYCPRGKGSVNVSGDAGQTNDMVERGLPLHARVDAAGKRSVQHTERMRSCLSVARGWSVNWRFPACIYRRGSRGSGLPATYSRDPQITSKGGEMQFSPGVVEAIGSTPLIKLKRASADTGCVILGKAEFMNPGQSV